MLTLDLAANEKRAEERYQQSPLLEHGRLVSACAERVRPSALSSCSLLHDRYDLFTSCRLSSHSVSSPLSCVRIRTYHVSRLILHIIKIIYDSSLTHNIHIHIHILKLASVKLYKTFLIFVILL